VRYFTTGQVAHILGGEQPLKQVTVQKLCLRGAFPHAQRHGRAWLIPERDLTPEMRARYVGGARPKGGRPRGSGKKRAA
jgi:hypothetical protein